MYGVILIVFLMIADGVFYSAHAQCAATDKIYIDPRLVPRRPQISREGYQAIMNAPGIPDAIKLDAHRKMTEQNQPIVIPYETGKVLVHPTNPCIQQYIP
jgi:hypothetical protein